MRWAVALVAGVILAGCAATEDAPEDPSSDKEAARRDLSTDPNVPVRPGQGIVSNTNGATSATHGYSCTAGFVVRSPLNGTYYLATAGHCVADQERGTRVPVGFEGVAPTQYARLVYVSMWSEPEIDQDSCGNGVDFADRRECFNDLAL